ncbi:MAG: hypothetical protein SH850_17245 [Planctomycetaceae bacterium]|nr:hypothetical protein [Planctomycetaceae bacterium]
MTTDNAPPDEQQIRSLASIAAKSKTLDGFIKWLHDTEGARSRPYPNDANLLREKADYDSRLSLAEREPGPPRRWAYPVHWFLDRVKSRIDWTSSDETTKDGFFKDHKLIAGRLVERLARVDEPTRRELYAELLSKFSFLVEPLAAHLHDGLAKTEAERLATDADYRPATWFKKGLAARLRMAARIDRKSKHVRTRTIDGVRCYSVADARRWWPDVVPNEA